MAPTDDRVRDGPRWWHLLTDPHPAIKTVGRRRRVRLAAGLLLVLIPIAVLFALYYAGPGNVARTPTGMSTWGAVVGLILAYVWMRGRHARVGKLLLVLVPWLALVAYGWTVGPTAGTRLYYYGAIPIILASLVLPFRMAAGFAVLNMAALLYLSIDETGTVSGTAADALFFDLVVVGLMLMGSGFLESNLRQQEQTNRLLRQTEQERARLLSVVAHDLASPLTPIQLQLELARRKRGDDKHLVIVQRNVDHLERLIADIRDLTRIEADRLGLDVRPVDLAGIVETAVQSFDDPMREQGVTPRVDVRGPLPAEVDPDRINQVLYNLMTNALKFSPQGTNVDVWARAADGHAIVMVRDQGRGLDTEEIQRLFRPFSQVHARHEVKDRGTGLGLFISKTIIEGHGGRIWAESEGHGKGAAFRFQIPLKTEGPPPAGAPYPTT